jgi:hypothetical protein
MAEFVSEFSQRYDVLFYSPMLTHVGALDEEDQSRALREMILRFPIPQKPE